MLVWLRRKHSDHGELQYYLPSIVCLWYKGRWANSFKIMSAEQTKTLRIDEEPERSNILGSFWLWKRKEKEREKIVATPGDSFSIKSNSSPDGTHSLSLSREASCLYTELEIRKFRHLHGITWPTRWEAMMWRLNQIGPNVKIGRSCKNEEPGTPVLTR